MSEEKRLKDVTCPKCKKEFQITWNCYTDTLVTLVIKWTPSGTFNISICCPYCNYEEDL